MGGTGVSRWGRRIGPGRGTGAAVDIESDIFLKQDFNNGLGGPPGMGAPRGATGSDLPVLQSLMPLRALNEFLPRPSATCGGLNRGIRAGQRGRSNGCAGRERKRPGAQPRGWGDGRRRRTAALAIARSRSNRGSPFTASTTFRGPLRSVRKSPIAGRGVLEGPATITGRPPEQRIPASDHRGGRWGLGDIVPRGFAAGEKRGGSR